MQIDRPISIVIILFAALILGFFFVVPEYKNLRALQVDLAQKKAEFNAKYDYFSGITKNYYEIRSRKEEMQKIDDALPPVSDFGQMIYYFQRKAHESGIILKNFSLSQSAPSKGIKDIIFSLSLSGDYFALQNFMVSLEKSARLFEISGISFGSGGGGPVSQFQDTGIFNFNLEVKTHSY